MGQWLTCEEAVVILQEEVFTLAFSPDGKTLARTNSQGVMLFDAVSGEPQLDLGWFWGTDAAYSPDGMTLACGTNDGVMILWDTTAGQERMRWLAHPFGEGRSAGVTSLCYGKDGDVIASGGQDATIRLWDSDSGQLLQTLTGHSGLIMPLVFSANGMTLASASMVIGDQIAGGNGVSDPGVEWHTDALALWDVATWTQRSSINTSGGVYAIAFSPDGRILAAGKDDSSIEFRDAATGAMIRTIRSHSSSVRSVTFSPDGKLLASGGGGRDPSVRLWDASTWLVLATDYGHTSAVTSVVYSQDGKLFASASTNEIRVWRVV